MSGFSGGGVLATAWSSYSPTVASTTGTITTASATVAIYTQVGKTVHCFLRISVTTNGTGAGQISISLPVASDGNQYIGSGFSATAAAALEARVGAIDASHASIYRYDGAYPAADGAVLLVSITYQAA